MQKTTAFYVRTNRYNMLCLIIFNLILTISLFGDSDMGQSTSATCDLTASSDLSDAFVHLEFSLASDLCAADNAGQNDALFIRILRAGPDGTEHRIYHEEVASIDPAQPFTHILDDYVDPGQRYNYRLEVRKKASGVLLLTLEAAGSTMPFLAPTDFAASDDLGNGVVRLSWTHHSDLPIVYRILRTHGSDPVIQIGALPVDSEASIDLTYEDVYSHTNTDLLSGQSYEYCIEPHYISTVTSYDVHCDQGAVVDVNFQASDDAFSDKISLSWTTPPLPFDRIDIIENNILIATLQPDATTYDVLDPIAGTDHIYRLHINQEDTVRLVAIDSGSIAPNGSISGRVVTQTQHIPLAGVSIQATATIDNETYSISTVSDDLGRYQLADLFYDASAEYVVTVKRSGYTFEEDDLSVTLSQGQGQKEHLDFYQLERFVVKDADRTDPDILIDDLFGVALSDQDKVQFEVDVLADLSPVYLHIVRNDEQVALLQYDDISSLITWTDSTGIPGERYQYDFDLYHIKDDTIISSRAAYRIAYPEVTTPDDFAATVYQDTGFVRLQWTHTSSNFDGFRLYRGEELIATLDKSVRQYTDRESLGGTVEYAVVAYRLVDGEEYYSNAPLLTTDYPHLPNPTFFIRPLPDRLSILWLPPALLTDGTFNYTGYKVYRDQQLIGEIYKEFPLEYVDYDGVPGEEYIYSLRTFRVINGKEILSNVPFVIGQRGVFPEVTSPTDCTVSDSAPEIPFAVHVQWNTALDNNIDGTAVLRGDTELARFHSFRGSNTISAIHAAAEEYQCKNFRTVDGVDYFSESLSDVGQPVISDTQLDPITDFQASHQYPKQIMLSWSYPSFIQANFIIEKLSQSGTYFLVDTIDATYYPDVRTDRDDMLTYSYADFGIFFGIHFYRIRAVSGDYVSPPSYTRGGITHPVRVQGRVYTQQGNVGIPNARIFFSTGFASIGPILTDSSGYYALQEAPGGRITVIAIAPNADLIEDRYTYNVPLGTTLDTTFDFISTYEFPVIGEEGIATITAVDATALDCDLDAVISWSTNHNNYDGIEILRGVNVIGEVPKGAPHVFTDTRNTNTGILQVYQVRAYIDTPTGRIYSNTKSTGVLLSALPPVQNLYARVDPAGNAVRLTWSHRCDELDGFLIQRNGTLIRTLPGFARPFYTDATGVPGETYTYSLIPFSEKDDITYHGVATDITIQYPDISPVAHLSYHVDAIPSVVLSDAPLQVNDPYTLDQITLTWSPYSSPHIKHIAVYREGLLLTDSLVASATSYQDTMGFPRNSYSYSVVVIEEREEQSYYSEASTIIATFPILSPPILDTITREDKLQIKIDNIRPRHIDRYRIFRGTSLDNFEFLRTLTYEDQTMYFHDGTAASGTEYFYAIQAVRGAETSQAVAIAYQSPELPVPANFTATVDSTYNTIFLDWDYDSSLDIYQFWIWSEGRVIATVDASDRRYEYIINEKQAGSSVEFQIQAIKFIPFPEERLIGSRVAVAIGTAPIIRERQATNGYNGTERPLLSYSESVAIDGNWLVMGQPKSQSFDGGIAIHQFDGTNWVFRQFFSIGSNGGGLGVQVDIDNNRIVAGGIADSEPKILEYDEGQDRWSEVELGETNFNGIKVAIKGNWVATLERLAEPGEINSTFLYRFDQGKFSIFDTIRPEYQSFRGNIDLSDDYLVIAQPSYFVEVEELSFKIFNDGRATVYKRTGNQWSYLQDLENNLYDVPQDTVFSLGRSVSISETKMALGAEDGVFTYYLEDGNWYSDVFIPAPEDVGGFGAAVSITDQHLAISASVDTISGQWKNIVYLYERSDDDDAWVLKPNTLPMDDNIESTTSVQAISLDDRFVAMVSTDFSFDPSTDINGVEYIIPVHPGLQGVSATRIDDNIAGKTIVTWTFDDGDHDPAIVKGFNVYRDTVKITPAILSPDTRVYEDSEGIAGKEHVYQVEMIWADDLPGPRMAAIGARPGVGRIEGKVVTNTPSQSGVAGVAIEATAFIDGEYYQYATVSGADGTYELPRLYIGTDVEVTVYELEVSFKDHIFSFDREVRLRQDQTIGNRLILDESAFVITGMVRRQDFSCGLDSVMVTAISKLSDGTEITEEGLTNEEGIYSLTIDPSRPGLEEIEVVIASERVLDQVSGMVEEYSFDTPESTMIRDFANLARVTNIDFIDHLTYPISINVFNACNKFISIDQFLIRVSSEDGCYDQVWKTSRGTPGRLIADLPPTAMTLRIENAENPGQPVETISLLAVDYFRFRPITLDLGIQHLDTLLTRQDIIRDNQIQFTYHRPPVISVAKGLDYVCDNPEFTALSEQNNDYNWTITVEEQHNGETCPVREGYIQVTNPGAVNTSPVVIPYDEGRRSFPPYSFKAGKANIVPPHLWAVSIEYFSPQESLLGRTEQNMLVEGIATVPGNGALVGADTTGGGLVQLPLFVLRKPPGDASYSSIATGTTITKSITVDESTEIAAGLIAETEGKIGGLGVFGSAELLFGGDTGDGQAWEYSITTSQEYSTEGVGDDLIVGMGVAQQYGLQQQVRINDEDCEQIQLTQILGFNPVKVETQWSYSVGEIEEIIRQLDLRIGRIAAGTEVINDPRGNALDVDEAVGQFEVIRDNWSSVLTYHRVNTVPHYVLCTQLLSDTLSQEVRQAIDDWQCDFCPKVAERYDCSTKTFTNFDPEVKWTQSLVDRYNKAHAAISGLLTNPAEPRTLDALRLSESRINDETAYLDAEFDALSRLPQAQYFTAGQEGGTRSFSAATSSTRAYSNSFFVNSELTAGLAWGLELSTGISIFGASITTKAINLEGKAGLKATINYNITEERAVTREETVDQTYFIGDDDPGDTYTVAVVQGSAQNHTPYFWTLGGNSSCPVEEGTLPRDRLDINLYNPETEAAIGKIQAQRNIAGDEAFFTVQLANTNLDEERYMEVFLVPSSNRNAATISLAGTQLGSEYVTIPAGGSVILDLLIHRGNRSYNHEHIQIGASPACNDGDVADGETQYLDLSAFFDSPCSDVTIVLPEDGWLINGRDQSMLGSKEVLQLNLIDFDFSNPHLKDIRLQYRRLHSEMTWTDMNNSVRSISELSATTNAGIDPYIFQWEITDNTDIIDGTYEIRAVALCESLGIETYSNYVRGRIDRTALTLFRTSPADRRWSPGVEIFAQFNKPLFEALLNQPTFMEEHFSLMNQTQDMMVPASFLKEDNRIYVRPDAVLTDLEGDTLVVTLRGVRDEIGNIYRELDMDNKEITDEVSWRFAISNQAVDLVEDQVTIHLYQGTTTALQVPVTRYTNGSKSISLDSDARWIHHAGQVILDDDRSDIVLQMDATDVAPGTYDDVLVLAYDDQQKSQGLMVRLVVYPPPPPDWKLPEQALNASTRIISNYRFRGTDHTSISQDTMDIISVWMNEVLVGLGNIQQKGSFYISDITAMVPETEGRLQIEYKVWRASEGRVYDVVPQESLQLRVGEIYGSTHAPTMLLIEPTTQQDMSEREEGGTDHVLQSTHEMHGGAIMVYPNPTSDRLYVNRLISDEDPIYILLTDALGREIYKQHVATEVDYNEQVIPMSHLTEGIYFLKIEKGDEVYVQRIVKQ